MGWTAPIRAQRPCTPFRAPGRAFVVVLVAAFWACSGTPDDPPDLPAGNRDDVADAREQSADPGATGDPDGFADPGEPGDPGPGADPGSRADPSDPSDPGDAGDPGPLLALSAPADGDRVVAGRPVAFRGRTACRGATITFVADGQYPFGTLDGVDGAFACDYAFNTPGVGRTVTVSVVGPGGCAASVDVTLDVQPPFSVRTESRTDVNGQAFAVHVAAFPTADPDTDLAVLGTETAATVRTLARAWTDRGVAVAVNGGYFAFGQGPVSYAKSRFGYESPSANVKGPRACLAWDAGRRHARVEVSMGRDPVSGATRFPGDSDVACAGPQLVEDGRNVFDAHFVSENFQTSGIAPDSAYPRTAACVHRDGSVLLVAAQDDGTKTRGFTLPGLADYLVSLGCDQALNLDGGGSTAFWNIGPPEDHRPGTEDRAVYHAVAILRP